MENHDKLLSEWYGKEDIEFDEKITEEQFANHDCHLSPCDSCATCEKYYEQKYTN